MRQPRIPHAPSYIERLYEFESLEYRDYKSIGQLDEITMGELTDMGLAMAEHPHPLAKNAGAWALMEAGTYRLNPRERIPASEQVDGWASNRLSVVSQAETIWREAIDGFCALKGEVRDMRKAGDVLGFELRARQAVAYMPNQQMIARLMAGERLSDEQLRTDAALSIAAVLGVGSLIADPIEESFHLSQTKNGFAHELTCGVLLQLADPTRILVTPASVRRDNHKKAAKRADLMATASKNTHRQVLISVTTKPEAGYSEVLGFSACNDMELPGDNSPRNTLNRLLEIRTGGDETTAQQLLALSAGLMQGLVAYENDTTRMRAKV